MEQLSVILVPITVAFDAQAISLTKAKLVKIHLCRGLFLHGKQRKTRRLRLGNSTTYSLSPPGRPLVSPVALAPLQQEITIILVLSRLQRYMKCFYITVALIYCRQRGNNGE